MDRYTPSGSDRRGRERFRIQAPLTVTLGKREIPALTRDLSNRGVYFYLAYSDRPQIGEDLDFVIELPPEVTLSDACRIRCHGRAVRTEETSPHETGVAAEILEYSIMSDPTSRSFEKPERDN